MGPDMKTRLSYNLFPPLIVLVVSSKEVCAGNLQLENVVNNFLI